MPCDRPLGVEELAVTDDRAIESLREALRLSPENVPLRRHLAESLLGRGRPDLAEAEFREALARAPDAAPSVEVERPGMGFADVGGMEPLKEEIRLKIIHPMNHPELYKAYGKPIGGGILLFGPPGCGKTHLARATAGEIRAGFLAIGINDVLDMWIGNSEKNLHALFEQARANIPCVLFFDEVDALGASRSDLRHS